MAEQIKQIAARLRGLREVLELTEQEVADTCQLSVEEYREIEAGTRDLSVSTLQKISRHYGIALDVLMFGEEPKMSSYFLTRSGTGISVERRKAYKYQALASDSAGASPTRSSSPSSPTGRHSRAVQFHQGQEFNIVIEGRMLLNINGKELILNAGDSLYFNSALPHGMLALDGRPVKFLAIIM